MPLTPEELDELIELDGLQREQTDDEFNRATDLFARMTPEQTAVYQSALFLPKVTY